MSIRLEETDSPDVIEVAGRGELQLAVLIESMRREGYELQVSRPEVITKDIDGRRHEPLERGVCDVPDEHVGTVTQALAPRKGRVTDLRPGDAGRTIVTFEAPARGLIGFRSLLLTATRGHGPAPPAPRRLDAVGRRAAPPHGRRHGGRPAGEHHGVRPRQPAAARASCSSVPARSSTRAWWWARTPARTRWWSTPCGRRRRPTSAPTPTTTAAKLAAARVHTLETAIEFIAEDELVEVTPTAVRIRKRLLDRAGPAGGPTSALVEPVQRRTAGWGSTARRRRRLLQLPGQQLVDGLADHLDDLVAHRDVDRRRRRRTRRGCRCTTSGTRGRPRPSRGASTPAGST